MVRQFTFKLGFMIDMWVGSSGPSQLPQNDKRFSGSSAEFLRDKIMGLLHQMRGHC